jgi:Xaa-Pro dipeptidase
MTTVSLGKMALGVLKQQLKNMKYPAKAHAATVESHFISKKLPATAENSAFFIASATYKQYPYCDQSAPLRQNRYFHYLTGVDQISGAYVLYTLSSKKLTLFLPNVDKEDIMWSGLPLSPEEAMEKYDVDEVLYAKDVEGTLKSLTESKVDIYTTDVDEYTDLPFSNLVTSGDDDFFFALDEARMIKDDFEISLMKHAAKITDNCHMAVMSALPIEHNETHMHAEFVYHSIRQGSKFQSYDPICCSGPSCGTLHYVKNDDPMDGKTSVLIDAGAEWQCYASDVTRCFPITGKFSEEHLNIYLAVKDMQTQVMEKIKPGVLWDDLHFLSHKVLIKHFVKLGLFHNGTEEDIFNSKVSAWFYPHGLGHLLGMDTHDVGGCPNYEDENILLRYLRLRRKLQKGMVVTDEPGIYFSPFLIENITEEQKKYVNMELVEKYMYVGGVRIEDDILVTEDGYENFTGITSDPQEIERIVQNGLKKGKGGFHVIA